MQQVGHLQRLKTKIYQNFLYQKKPSYARAVTTDTVTKILEYHKIDESSYALVKTIKPVYNPVSKSWTATPVFYDLTRLVKD